MTKEALQIALNALTDFDYDKRIKAIESIKEALKTKNEYERGFIDGMQKQMQSSVDKAVNAMGNTRPWYTIDELNAWADKYQNEQWHKAAIRLGEKLASVGPVGYYEMDAKEWLDWAMSTVKTRTWVGLTDEEIETIYAECNVWDKFEYERMLEAKLKERNT